VSASVYWDWWRKDRPNRAYERTEPGPSWDDLIANIERLVDESPEEVLHSTKDPNPRGDHGPHHTQ
jgi:hypothetical protein